MAAALGSFTEDAVWMAEGPALFGRQAIEGFLGGLFRMNLSNNVLNFDQVHVTGETAWAVGNWSNTGPGPNQSIQQYHGNWGAVYVRNGDTWKVRMLTTNLIESEASGR
jgi:ketosteroid isomerase-like protein